MHKQNGTENTKRQRTDLDVGRRNLLKLSGAGVAAGVVSVIDASAQQAGHVDLYDRVSLIPWDKLQSFFGTHLAGAKVRS